MTLDPEKIPDKRSPILLVEDEPNDVELTEIAFARAGIINPVVNCRDGVTALDYLLHRNDYAHLEAHDHPVLILLDIKLPKINGFEVLSEMRKHPELLLIPTVMLTSSKEHQDIVTSYATGCNSYIRKPVEFGEFIDTVRQTGIYWLLINQQSTGI